MGVFFGIWRIDMKIMILSAAVLIATTLSAAADHEGKADPELASNDALGGGVALEARFTGARAAYLSTVSKVENGEAVEALGAHLPVGRNFGNDNGE
jgi:hypothetical protein